MSLRLRENSIVWSCSQMAMARTPSHFGSKIQPSSSNASVPIVASIGERAGGSSLAGRRSSRNLTNQSFGSPFAVWKRCHTPLSRVPSSLNVTLPGSCSSTS